ncbi:MAG: oxidoreductase [Candidatus Marinimicrobia bacterium]|nr:oxidoreductase [Candidatus Neomarinimicrobiota bacterium]
MDKLILSLLIFLPVFGAILMMPISKYIGKDKIKWTALITAGLQLILAFWLYLNFNPASTIENSPFTVNVEWIKHFNIFYYVGVDGLSMPMVMLTALLSFICIIASWNIDKKPLGYFSLFLLLDAGMMGVFLSMDFFLFYIFWEVMLLPMYFLIGMWGGPQRHYAAIKFFLYTLFGSVFMLLSMLALYYYTTPNTFSLTTLIVEAPKIDAFLWGMDIRYLIWIGLFIGFAIKVPVFPFHTWLPLAHVEAPTAISVILAGVLLKMGTYGLLRISYPLLPGEAISFAFILAVLGVINILWGAVNAIAQIDLKKMVAYSSVSHMGYVLLGMASVVSTSPAGAQAGLNGAVMQMFNHGTITAMLFLLVGVLYDQAHHRWIVYPDDYKDQEVAGKIAFGGLASKMPIFNGMIILAFFAGLGLPALSGFISEALCFIGGFSAFRTVTIIGTLGILLNAVYFLRAYQRVFTGKLNEKYENLKDINNRELLTVIPIAILVLFFGVYPAPLVNLISPAIDSLITLIQGVM